MINGLLIVLIILFVLFLDGVSIVAFLFATVCFHLFRALKFPFLGRSILCVLLCSLQALRTRTLTLNLSQEDVVSH